MTPQQIKYAAPEGANKYMITKQGIQYFQREYMNMWYLWEDKQWKIIDSTLIYIVKNKAKPL